MVLIKDIMLIVVLLSLLLYFELGKYLRKRIKLTEKDYKG